MDPLARTQLQNDIAKFAVEARKDDDAQALILSAQQAYKQRNWAEAQNLFEKAKEIFTPDVPITQLLCDKGFAISRAQARRYVRSGAVLVDGVRLRKDNIAVTKKQFVTFNGDTVQEPVK